MKISPEMDLGMRESPIHFGSHPESADLRQLLEKNRTWPHDISWSDLLENFTRDGFWDEEIPNTFLQSSGERRPPATTRNGAPDHMISADQIFLKISLELYLRIRKFPLDFRNHLENADLCQCLTTLHENFARYRSWEKRLPAKFWKVSGECRPLSMPNNILWKFYQIRIFGKESLY